ncbi:DNA polymerase family B-domain-containing protein [Rhizophagus clarus]|uniref:DNA polymerase family B-domain-containing protein n=1 Tax=Rhizophagus clarus TaxID=94130 RepID=A0A8H3MAV5_9GLOM|nr:DNA polymerase family B-domain-containing protein [Rhizophagus clarus]
MEFLEQFVGIYSQFLQAFSNDNVLLIYVFLHAYRNSHIWILNSLHTQLLFAENDGGLTAILDNTLSNYREIPFMAVDFGGSLEKIGEKNCYILRLYGSLINGQKAIKIDKILCSTINAYKIEPIKTFPFHGYHTKIKLYLRVFTHGTGNRKKALQAIQDNDFKTASDDISSFHCKIARENGIAISGWSMMSKYCCRKHPQYTYNFHVSMQMTGDFKSSEEIQKWNYYGKIGVNSKNTFQKKKGVTDNEKEEEFRVQPIKVKIYPEEDFISIFLKISGCVPIDVRVCFKKLYPHAEVDKKSLLVFYLKKCGLGGMHEVAYYCVIDALHCQKLMVKKNVINDYREVVSIAYVSLFDSHYCANGMRTWTVRHDNQFEKKGLYPVMLEDLYNKRVELKVQFASLGKKKERLGKIISLAKERAGGTTLARKYNLNLVVEFVSEKGFGIKYGDTDSLYLTCPDKYYKKCDRVFNEGKLSKEEYWAEMVNITMGVMKKLRDQVNAYLRIKNGISYLKMVYKEVLFPVCFTGKKKYFGVPHKGIVNFRLDDLFRKEIDTVKQGQSQLFKFIGKKIMWEAMDINNMHLIHKIVEDTLREAKHKQ